MKKTILITLLMFVFAIKNSNAQTGIGIITTNTDSIYTRVEVMPSFPGGASELMKFIAANVYYPIDALKKKAEGKVIVNFYIDVDGSVKEPKILKDPVGYGCAEEVLRVLSIMPNWSPGMKDGEAVKVYYTLPVTFKLR